VARRVRNVSSTPVALYDEAGAAVTAFDLAAGAEVALVTGTAVDLVAGAAVDLAAGAEVALVTGTTVTAGGTTTTIGTEFTRPADTDAYAALDAVSDSTSAPTIITLADVVPAVGGTGYITKVRCFTDKAAAMAPRFRIHIYNESITPINDNAAFTLLYANRAKRVAAVDLAAFRTEGAGSDASAAQNITDRVAFACAPASRALFALVETLDAFTPASGQKFYLEISVEAN
jgi:hypothetical protein